MKGKFFCGTCGRLLYDSLDGEMRFVAAELLPCAGCGASNIRGELVAKEKITHHSSVAEKPKTFSAKFS